MRSAAASGVRRRRGAALVEVVISMLLIMVAVAAIMGSMLASSLQTGPSNGQAGPSGVDQHQEQATLCLNQLLQELKNYVTADHTTYTQDAPNGAAAAGWTIPGDTCSNCWALTPGQHTINVAQAQSTSACANAASLSYTVTSNSDGTSQVVANITWNP
jgi:hypothetical protein